MYGKIFASLYQGTLRGKAHEILVFTNMIACADQTGIVDKHPRAIAEEIGLDLESTKSAIASLEAPDPESRSLDNGGARIVKAFDGRAWGWQIVNYVKYRSIRSEEDRREQNRMAQERWRNKSKPSVSNSKPPSADVSRDKPSSAESKRDKPKEKEREKEKEKEENTYVADAPCAFDLFWESYQKKTTKKQSVAYWNRMSPSDRDAALAGVDSFLVTKPDPQYRPDPIRYLRDRRWEDEQSDPIANDGSWESFKRQTFADCPAPTQDAIDYAIEMGKKLKAGLIKG